MAREVDYRELKEELGLDHDEGRHGLGGQHHVTLVSMAGVFLRCEQVRAKKKLRARPCRRRGSNGRRLSLDFPAVAPEAKQLLIQIIT